MSQVKPGPINFPTKSFNPPFMPKPPVYEKKDDNTMIQRVEKTEENTFDYDFLKRQKVTLEEELQRVNDLLAEADALGLESKTDTL